MEGSQLMDVFQHMLFFTTAAIVLILLPGLIVGFIISVFQAATQINEMTLSFLPKLIVMMLLLAVASPWLLHKMMEFTEDLITNLPNFIG